MATVTKKTLVLKRPPPAPSGPAEAPTAEPATASPAADLPPPAMVRPPTPSETVPGRSYTVDAVCALLAVLLLLALLGVQWMEGGFYRDAFPHPAALLR